MARRSSKFRLAALGVVALLPGFLKRPLYRGLFGYRIGRRVRLGFTLIDAAECVIEAFSTGPIHTRNALAKSAATTAAAASISRTPTAIF